MRDSVTIEDQIVAHIASTLTVAGVMSCSGSTWKIALY